MDFSKTESNMRTASIKNQKNESSKSNNILDSKKIGRVIMIPNDSTILIDLGSDEISVNRKVKVIEILSNITNINGDVLGEYKHIKAVLSVVEVHKNYSICKNLVKRKSNISLIVSSNVEHEYEYAKILVNEEQNLNLIPKNPKISLGDPVEIF